MKFSFSRIALNNRMHGWNTCPKLGPIYFFLDLFFVTSYLMESPGEPEKLHILL